MVALGVAPRAEMRGMPPDISHNCGVSTRTMTRQRTAAPRQRSAWSVMVSWLLVALVAVLVIAPVAAAADIVVSARAYDTTPTDAIAVLGASQYWGDPSPVFSNRLDHAYDLWSQGVAPLILTVGGKIDGDITTEAEAGRRYLIDKGVPADQVIALPAGSNTLESVSMIGDELRSRGLGSVTLVSDRLHLARTKAIAKALGLEAHVSGRAFADGSSFGPGRFAHELAGLVKFHLWDRWSLQQSDPQG